MRLNALLKPLPRVIDAFALPVLGRRNGASFLGAVVADVLTTLRLAPLTTVSILVFAAVSVSVDSSSLRSGVLPAIFAALVLALADITARDRFAGMMNLLFTAPNLRESYVAWKYASALCVTFSFVAIPIVRLISALPSAAASLFVGSCFTASGAVGLGVLSGSRKPFIALFLMLLYISLNSKDAPAFDFAGFHANTNAGVQLAYAGFTAVFVLTGHLRHRRTLRDL